MSPKKSKQSPELASSRQPQPVSGPKILRIGVIQSGKIVEEKLVRERETVTIGASTRNTIVVPTSSMPRSFTLFELAQDRYHLVFGDEMDGRISVGGEVLALDEVRTSGKAQSRAKGLFRLALDESSRGKIVIGEVSLLFQFVAPPPIQPRPQLPPSVRGSLVGQLDLHFAWSLVSTATAVTAFILYLHSMDLPRELAPDVIPDDFAEFIPTIEQKKPEKPDISKWEKLGEKKVKKVKKAAPAKRKVRKARRGPTPKKAPPCDAACQQARAEARRARLLEEVSKVGALKILGAKGKGSGSASDLLSSGDPGTAADKAFDGLGGLTTRGQGGGRGLRGKGGGGSGKAVGIGDLGARVGGPGKVATGGRVVERVPRAIVKRSGKIERDSTLKGDAVARIVRRGMTAIKGCYQRALKRNPKLSGKISIRLTISSTGKVTDVEIETDTIGDDQVASCISGYAKRWRFPPPDGGGSAEVAVPFVFQASN